MLSSLLLLASSEPNQPFKFKGVIFDCDGVLVDTEKLKYLAWKQAFEKYGITIRIQDFNHLCGHTSKYILDKICKKYERDVPAGFLREKREIYKRLQEKGVTSFHSAITFLKELHALKREYRIRIGLASSASYQEINRNLKQVGIEKMFDVIVSGKDDLKEYQDSDGVNKPKPYIYKKAAKLLKVKPEECIVFEDSEAGVIAADAAGCHVIAVPNDFTIGHDFSRAERVLKEGFANFSPKELFLHQLSTKIDKSRIKALQS